MHRVLLILLLTTFAFSQQEMAPPPPAQGPAPKAPANLNDSENARKARALIDQMIQALGGQAYLTYTNKGEAGRYYPLYHGRTNSTGVPYNYYIAYPDKDRFEVIHLKDIFLLYGEIGNVQTKAKPDIVLIHNGLKGYETTYKGTAAEEPAETAAHIRRREHSLDQVTRKWINDPTVALFYDGGTVSETKAAEQVTLLNSQNDSVTIFLDQFTHLPIKISFSWRDPKDKQKNTEQEVYDNYRLIQGIMTPYSVTRYFNGETSQQRFLKLAKYNLTLPDSMFEAQVSYDPYAPTKKRK